MSAVNVHEAKTHLSRLLAQVAKGKKIVIARNGVPIAELRPFTEAPVERHLGELRGKIRMSDDFNAPLPDDILDDFER